MTANASDRTPLAPTVKSAVRPAVLLLVLGVVLALSGCAGAMADTAGSSSATTTTYPPPGICDRQCDELRVIRQLSTFEFCGAVSGECLTQLKRAGLAIQAVRKDLAEHGISQADYPDLDRAITQTTKAVGDMQTTCTPSAESKTLTIDDAATCASRTSVVLGDVGGLVILLGGTP